MKTKLYFEKKRRYKEGNFNKIRQEATFWSVNELRHVKCGAYLQGAPLEFLLVPASSKYIHYHMMNWGLCKRNDKVEQIGKTITNILRQSWEYWGSWQENLHKNYSILSSWKSVHSIRKMLIFSVSITTQWNGKCAQYQGCENSHEAWHTEKNLQKIHYRKSSTN